MWIGVCFTVSDRMKSSKLGNFSEVKAWGMQIMANDPGASRVVLYEAKFQIKTISPPVLFLDIDGTPVEGENKPVNETAIT